MSAFNEKANSYHCVIDQTDHSSQTKYNYKNSDFMKNDNFSGKIILLYVCLRFNFFLMWKVPQVLYISHRQVIIIIIESVPKSSIIFKKTKKIPPNPAMSRKWFLWLYKYPYEKQATYNIA